MNRIPSTDGDTMVLSLEKGKERYLFAYEDEEEERRQMLRVLGRFASDKELSFSWTDAAVLSQKIRESW